MSRSQKDVAADIEQGCRELMIHLVKLWFFPDAAYKFHWRKEVAEKLNHVDSFKGSHKYPSPKFILRHSWEVHRPRLQHVIEYVTEDYGLCENPEGTQDLEIYIDAYFTWLATELSKYGDVTYKRIYNKLEELGF